jgi:hypothetical protein
MTMTHRLAYMLKRSRVMAAERARVHDPGPAPCTAAREVPMTELDRRAAAVIRGIRTGEVAVVSKHRRAVAMILPHRRYRSLRKGR